MASTPKPIRKVIKKASNKHMKRMETNPELHKQFGSPSKKETRAMLEKHEGRLKEHAKKHGQVAMPHHPNYSKVKAEKAKALAHMEKHKG